MAEEVDFQEAKKTNIQRIFSLSSGMGWSLYRKDYRMPRSVILLTNAAWSRGYQKNGVGEDHEQSRLGNTKKGPELNTNIVSGDMFPLTWQHRQNHTHTEWADAHLGLNSVSSCRVILSFPLHHISSKP